MAGARVIPLHDPERDAARRSRHVEVVPEPAQQQPETSDWERRLADLLSFARRRIAGDYQIDEFGFDRDLTENVLMPPLKPLYEKWFRVETRGLMSTFSLTTCTGSGLVRRHRRKCQEIAAIESIYTNLLNGSTRYRNAGMKFGVDPFRGLMALPS